MRQRYWRVACYNAGVLSHYYTDPIQPFHTAQSAAESNIHRAAEWSITRSYKELRALLTSGTGYPEVEVFSGADWLERMVKAGAEAANPYYEPLIEHYDMPRGVSNPPAGFDAVDKEILARLIGHATVGLARILERAFEEVGMRPPAVHLTLETFLATLKMLVRWVAQDLEDERERELVTAIYEELQSNGRVEENLPEDDRTVRDLHAKEVLSATAGSAGQQQEPTSKPVIGRKPERGANSSDSFHSPSRLSLLDAQHLSRRR